MKQKLQNLLGERKELNEEKNNLLKERKNFNYFAKNFNMTTIIGITTGIILMLPMALYIIPIIPKTYTLAGETMKGLTPIISQNISIDLLVPSATIGSTIFLASATALTLGNILYFIPLKKFNKTLVKKIDKKLEIINTKILKEDLYTNNNINNKNNYNNKNQILIQENDYKYRKKEFYQNKEGKNINE